MGYVSQKDVTQSSIRGGTAMMSRVFSVAMILAAMVAPAAAQTEPRWSVTFGVGTAPTVSGIYHEGGSGTVLALATQVDERDWSDIYNSGFTMRAGVGYAVSPMLEITGTFSIPASGCGGAVGWQCRRPRSTVAFRGLSRLGCRGRHPLALRARLAGESIYWCRWRLSSRGRDAGDLRRARRRRRARGHTFL